MEGNNMSKFDLIKIYTPNDRKLFHQLQYTEMLTPDAIKTSSRKKMINKIVTYCALNHEDFNRKKRASSDN